MADFLDVAADPELWAATLQAVAAGFDGLACGLRMESPSGKVEQVWWGLPRDFEQAYLQHYHALDPWMPVGRTLPVGRCSPSQELVPDALLDASEFYQDFLRPRGLREIVGGLADRDQRYGFTTLAVMRADGARPFDRHDAARLEAVLPRVQHALWMDRRFRELDESAGQSGVARIVIDLDGRIHSANSAAAKLLTAGDVVANAGGKLVATCPLSNDTLARRVGELARRPAATRGPALLPLRRARGPSLVASVTPLGEHVSRARVDGPRPGILVIVHDPLEDLDVAAVASKLRTLCGATPAQARIGALLGSGRSPAAIAEELGITVGTVRFQLKQLYAVTGTSGQRELVRLASLLARL